MKPFYLDFSEGGQVRLSIEEVAL